jgi:hypothetical protein
MTSNPLTHRQAKALAALVHELRGDWDTPGILDALGRARDIAPGPDLAIAAIKAAGSAHNRTPAVIALEGPHWRGSDTPPRREAPSKDDTCSVCYQHKDVCRSRWESDHDFQPLTDGRRPADNRDQALETARAALTKHGLCSHGVPPTHCGDHRPAPTPEGPA